MKAVLLDTHVWAWGLYASRRLSTTARGAIVDAGAAWISPASMYEISQKVRLGKWPEMAPFASNLMNELAAQNAEFAALDAAICLQAGAMRWTHRDPFDRMLAATALHYGVPIISADPVFDGVVSRIW